MNTRTRLLVTLACACGLAATATVGLVVWRAKPERGAAPAHGEFSARLQPVLEGIGSMRNLSPVPLSAAPAPQRTAAGGLAAPSKDHRPHEHRRPSP